MDLTTIDSKVKRKIKEVLNHIKCTNIKYVSTANSQVQNDNDGELYCHFVVGNDEDVLKIREELANILGPAVRVYTQEELEEIAQYNQNNPLGKWYKYDLDNLKPLMPLLDAASIYDSDH